MKLVTLALLPLTTTDHDVDRLLDDIRTSR